MRIYTIDDDRNFVCEIESGKHCGRIMLNLQTGYFSADRPANMSMYIWHYYLQEFLKMSSKMFKPSPDKFNDLD